MAHVLRSLGLIMRLTSANFRVFFAFPIGRTLVGERARRCWDCVRSVTGSGVLARQQCTINDSCSRNTKPRGKLGYLQDTAFQYTGGAASKHPCCCTTATSTTIHPMHACLLDL